MKDKYSLLQKGLFPETLPPCFDSQDLKRAFRGIVRELDEKPFRNRSSDYIRYSSTKHDGSRRYFGTPNPISYYYVSKFIFQNWKKFDQRFKESPFSVSVTKVADEKADRPIIISSLSELTSKASKNIGYSPYILKTDIAQFFPSIYTHTIPWSAHGVSESKIDQNIQSKNIIFNQLDFFTRNCQQAQTRGVLVGPDAFRLIAEFIIVGLDSELKNKVGTHIIGAARHVDDYYIGLRSETDAIVVLSHLREILHRYELQINDSKTKILSGLEPLNELWAQDLRNEAKSIGNVYQFQSADRIILFLDKSIAIARDIKSDSPIKIALRTLDQMKIYRDFNSNWDIIEPYLQRIMFHHSHCIDYITLLVAKRAALGGSVDLQGWKDAIYYLIKRHVAFNHHHEIIWLTWLSFCIGAKLSEELVSDLISCRNSHLHAFLVQGFIDGYIDKKPKIRFENRLASTKDDWLLNVVARSTEFCKAKFGGDMSAEFEHLSSKTVSLIDIQKHIKILQKENTHAISRTRYGYDGDDEETNGGFDDDIVL